MSTRLQFLFKYLNPNITSNSFGNSVINKWFPAPVVGEGAGPPPSFPKCPFLPWKISFRLHFLPKRHFWKLEFMLCPEHFFHFQEKYYISRKNFGMSGKFFWDELPPRRHSKSAPQSIPPPQLLDASYAPVYENIRLFVYNRMKNLMRSIKTFKFKNTTDLLI